MWRERRELAGSPISTDGRDLQDLYDMRYPVAALPDNKIVNTVTLGAPAPSERDVKRDLRHRLSSRQVEVVLMAV